MLWILKMMIETPKAVLNYRKDYYNQKKIRKCIKQEGLVAGFYLHDELYGADIHEWMALCEHITERDEDVPQGLIDMALDKGWIAMKADYLEDETPALEKPDWEAWENA
jgi:hypothetical protein